MRINNDFGNNVLLGLLFVGGGTCLLIISLLRFVYDFVNLKKTAWLTIFNDYFIPVFACVDNLSRKNVLQAHLLFLIII